MSPDLQFKKMIDNVINTKVHLFTSLIPQGAFLCSIQYLLLFVTGCHLHMKW